MIETTFTVTAVALYLLAGTGLALRLARVGPAMAARNLFLGLGGLGVLAHAVVVYQATFSGEHLDLSFFNAASLIAWLMVALMLLTTLRRPVENLGIALLPIAAVCVLLSRIFHAAPGAQPGYAPGVDAHIVLSIIAYSILGIAAVQAVLLAVQDYHLRHRHPGGFIRMLPPLQTMEDLLFQMLWCGFAALTLALLTGFVFLEDLFAQHLVHKTVLSIVAWLVFGTLLWGHRQFGWRGPKAIQLTLAGFAFLMLAYFGSKLVLEIILR
ncbi:cytochrome c biogenesis protein CcsA [Ectothiorhodospiraceae bacterium WFHF3C12]|nr:cytochrome c biogenesis protein CcsA [Ectothiorhodospiraceae bacterium WFHF3C12]